MAKARILDRIRSPDDLKGLSREALHQLADLGGHRLCPLALAVGRDGGSILRESTVQIPACISRYQLPSAFISIR